MSKKKIAYQRGAKGEGVAVFFLRLKGYSILARRYKTPVGEVDVIAKRGTTLVFAEVKARDDLNAALEAVTPHQQRRIRRAAEYYLATHPHPETGTVRFDTLVVLSPFHIRHIENAFGFDGK